MTRPSALSRKDKGLCALLWELSDDEEDIVADTGLDVPYDPQWPWLCDYHAYMDVLKQVPEGWTAIQWWGIIIPDWIFIQATNITSQYNWQCYHPAWGSLAQDYLAIMSSSISSEHAFLQGGITISKWCSRLKGDIVEALQCISMWLGMIYFFKNLNHHQYQKQRKLATKSWTMREPEGTQETLKSQMLKSFHGMGYWLRMRMRMRRQCIGLSSLVASHIIISWPVNNKNQPVTHKNCGLGQAKPKPSPGWWLWPGVLESQSHLRPSQSQAGTPLDKMTIEEQECTNLLSNQNIKMTLWSIKIKPRS